jgi:hypothetical protein
MKRKSEERRRGEHGQVEREKKEEGEKMGRGGAVDRGEEI